MIKGGEVVAVGLLQRQRELWLDNSGWCEYCSYKMV